MDVGRTTSAGVFLRGDSEKVNSGCGSECTSEVCLGIGRVTASVCVYSEKCLLCSRDCCQSRSIFG